MTIAAILTGKGNEVICIETSTRVGDAVQLLAEKRIGAVPVLENGLVAGIFSERDVIAGLLREGAAVLERNVAEVMTAPAITVAPEQSVLAALSLMTRRRIRHLPVIEEGRLAGFVSIGDLVKFRIDKIEAEAMAMREYIQNA
ncbi:CBS domain-containing protein [Sphingomonas sanxanigenens]|uniref:CBS domain-containing protein n=1 Tax=Sphingomonas sanxanigenens DSM 19645 = NX02 TaxID=1123269 RepID=W0AJS0_9SPHN|nr:CBS domain-containing protein [Sphingomonas sanxanigenens]AHE56822.1 hypothetical protein NX02_26100 [Sphingomonas sanxanigenens DSM 19645 = NX02]